MKQYLKEKAVNHSYYLMMFFLPLSIFMDNIALILLLIFTILYYKRRIINYDVFFGSLVVLFFYNVISGFISGAFLEEKSNFVKLIPLILIPIGMSILDNNIKKKGLLLLLLGIFVMQIAAVYGIINYYLFTEGKRVSLRSYANINEILFFERPYLGYFSSLSIIISYFYFRKQKAWYFVFTMILSILLIIIISARLAIIILIVSLLLVLLFEIKNKLLKLFTLLSIPLISIIILSISNIPLKHRFMQIKYDTRIMVWEGAFYSFIEAPSIVFGYGGQERVEEKLIDYYKNKAEFEYKPDRDRFLIKKYNSHNQYINELLRGGILGLMIFITPLIYLFIKNIRNFYLLNILLLFSIILFFFVENLLERQIGVYCVAIILSISNSYKYEKN